MCIRDRKEDAAERAPRNQREDARRGVALAEIGEHVEADDDPDEDDDDEIGLQVGAGDERRQVFVAAGPAGLAWRRLMICSIMSMGIGKTITVLRSTPISVSVCR